jgi:hypothetical protein
VRRVRAEGHSGGSGSGGGGAPALVAKGSLHERSCLDAKGGCSSGERGFGLKQRRQRHNAAAAAVVVFF